MKRAALTAAILFSSFAGIFAEETRVSALIEKQENWTPKNSPYIVEGDAVIEKTGFVKVHPGTVIKFKENGRLVVKGGFYAEGSPENPVRFIPADNESFYPGIRFESKYKNKIDNAVIIRASVEVEGSQLEFTDNYVLNSTGLIILHYGSVLVKDNYFYNNTYGVYCEGAGAKFTATGNTFHRNRFAVYIKRSENELITKNNFMENSVSLTNYSPRNIKSPENYWGTGEEKNIAGQIFDRANSAKSGAVEYKPFSAVKLKLYTPSQAHYTVAKYYLSLKRADEEDYRAGFSAGLGGAMPFSPDVLKDSGSYALSLLGGFTVNITGAFLAGVDFTHFTLENKEKELFDYRMELTNMLVTGTGYFGYKKRAYFLPYAKIGAGVALLSQQYRFSGDLRTQKQNEIAFSGAAGLGIEWFVLSFFSVKAEGAYNFIASRYGNIGQASGVVAGTLYLELPFFLSADIKP